MRKTRTVESDGHVGAVHVQTRAAGNVPVWARRAPPRAPQAPPVITPSPVLPELHWQSIPAEMRDPIMPPPEMVVIPEERMIIPAQNTTDTGLGATTDPALHSNDPLPPSTTRSKNPWTRQVCISSVLVLVAALAVGLGLGLSRSSSTTPAPLLGECDFVGQEEPNLDLQCTCDGAVTKLLPATMDRYESIHRQFPDWYRLTFDKTVSGMQSCDPINLALLRVAADDSNIATALQMYVLHVLYNMWEGNTWNVQYQNNTTYGLPWFSNNDECSWKYIQCNMSKVDVLNSYDDDNDNETNWLRPTGSLPLEIALLTDLGKLNMVSNDLTGTLPTNLGLLTHLSEVYLRRSDELAGHRSQLQGTLPTEIGRLANLIALDISGTNMTGSIPTQLGQLTNLVALVLADAQFKSIPMQQLSHLTQLTKLDLNGNTQSSSQRMPAALGQLTKLRELHLNACGLTGTIPDAVGNLTNLVLLYLGNNDFVGPIPLTIGQLSTIERLAFNDNRLNGTFPQHPFFSLTDLALQGNNLTGTIPELGNMTNLERFELSDNSFTGTIPTTVGLLSYLSVFDVSSNYLSGTIPTEIDNCLNLRMINVGYNLLLNGPLPSGIMGQMVDIDGTGIVEPQPQP